MDDHAVHKLDHTCINITQIIKEKINKASESDSSSTQCLKVVSLKIDNDSPLKSPEGRQSIQEAGIEGIEDVGRWIVDSLEAPLKEIKTAEMLKCYLRSHNITI